MRVLLISYGIFEFDGRLNELLHVADNIGKTETVMLTTLYEDDVNHKYVRIARENYLKRHTYMSYLKACISAANKIKEPYILFADNLFAAIPALLIRLFHKPKYIIQDVRELYYPKEIKSKFGRFCCKCEIKLMKKADAVICANEQRADIMLKRYRLKEKPIVYENIRFLTDGYNKSALDKKYAGMFDGRIKIVSTGGLSVLRGADKLVSAMVKLPHDYELYILGGGSDSDMAIIENIIRLNGLDNCVLLPKVPLGELRYILSRCDIGIVHYHKNDDNNRYCASGKIYEYLAEGLPIVTTENEPLVDFCERNSVGVSDDTFADGIFEVAKNIKVYKKRVKEYITGVSPQKSNVDCAIEIKQRVKIE